MIFRHFTTRKEAKAFIETQHEFPRLVIRKKGKAHKPFMVGTELSFLHFS